MSQTLSASLKNKLRTETQQHQFSAKNRLTGYYYYYYCFCCCYVLYELYELVFPEPSKFTVCIFREIVTLQ